MTTETHTVAMTDPQLANNNNNNNNSGNNNNNNDGETKYLHKKFKKMATAEVTPKAETQRDSSKPPKKNRSIKDFRETPKDPIRILVSPEHVDGDSIESEKRGFQRIKTGRETNKASEESDTSLSDGASNGTDTPPPSSSSTNVSTIKAIKSGKIYKPKFHTALQSVNKDIEPPSSLSFINNSSITTPNPRPNSERVQEHIDKIITANQVIVGAVDPRLHKLIQRQPSHPESKQFEPLNLSFAENFSSRKRCYTENFRKENDRHNRDDARENGTYPCSFCNVPYSSINEFDSNHRCRRCSSRKSDYESKSSDYYTTLQPLASPGPLLGNTRLIDTYAPPLKKQRLEPTSLLSLDELGRYRPNSVQMFGGEVKILDKTGETKTMRIEPRQSNSPTSEHTVVSNNCIATETASIVVRSGLHSGGTIMHKPSETPVTSPTPPISLPNAPQILAPIIPNISTASIMPSMSSYASYLEPRLKPLTSITAYNPLTLPQSDIASILHGGKVIPYVPGMPGPYTLTPIADVSPGLVTGEVGYKVIPGLPGLHVTPRSGLASPANTQVSSVPGILGPMSNSQVGPLDLASPAKDSQFGLKENSVSKPVSPKVPSVIVENSERYRRVSVDKTESDRHLKVNSNSAVNGTKIIPSLPVVSLNLDKASKTEMPSQASVDLSSKPDAKLVRNDGVDSVKRETSSNKFLRPTSLPLNPGTFTPKKHHGITPTANTLPLISPETPRPKKSYAQLYLNGHAYTYLGLKCSTRLFYCTLNRPQPMYVTQQHGLSMYSNWKICEEQPSDVDMRHYDSRHRSANYTIAWQKQEDILTDSSQRPTTPNSSDSGSEKEEKGKKADSGSESNEDRSRGRGRYVCEKCGTRCRKSSMLKKHIKTHTDEKLSECKHCAVSPPPKQRVNVDTNNSSLSVSSPSSNDTDNSSTNNSTKPTNTLERTSDGRTVNQEIRSVSQETRSVPTDLRIPSPRNLEIRPPIKEIRTPGLVSRTSSIGGRNGKPQAEFLQPSNGPAPNYISVTEDGRSVCVICNKVFNKSSQLRLHINIHYFERPFRCESCAVSFRTKGHLTKHERSVSHHNKVSMTSTFGTATTSNPRPFKCTDCKIAFRIHGHLAKHLRSKMHIMKLECIGKLPFGTYAEMERSGVSLNDIDTTDCDNSLTSLQILAQKLCENDPSKIGQWEPGTIPNQSNSGGETSSDEGEPIPS